MLFGYLIIKVNLDLNSQSFVTCCKGTKNIFHIGNYINLGNKSGVDTYVKQGLCEYYSQNGFSLSPSILHDELTVSL